MRLCCKRCGHEWFPRTDREPVVCPKCKSYKWPRYKDYLGKDALAYVLSKNLNRRHLNGTQRANLALELREQGRCPENALLANDVKYFTEMTDEQVAQVAGVSRPTVAAAKTVRARGDAETRAQMNDGKLSATAAAQIINNKPKETPLQKVLRLIDKLNDEEQAEIGEAYCVQCSKD